MTPPGPGLRFRRTASGVSFWIHVTPRARREAVGGTHGDALRVAVTEPPEGGRANAACSRVLAETLGVGRGEVELDPKSRGRRKRVEVRAPGHGDGARLERQLRALAAPRGGQ